MRRSLLLLAVFAASAAPVAHAQGSAQGPTLLEPFDWGPDAAWRRRANLVRETRMQLLRAGNLRELNAVRGGPFFAPSLRVGGGPATAVTGAFQVPVILIAYKDIPAPYPVSDYQCLLFSVIPATCGFGPNHPYSVSNFYAELSHNRISMNGVVFPTVRMDSVGAFYTDGCKGITVTNNTSCPDRSATGGNRMALMLKAALDSISNRSDGATVWAQFDNDGPDAIPNSGDDDGVVDFVTFLQPEVGGECTQNVPATTGVWSHRFVIAGWTGQPYVTKTPRAGPGGAPMPGQFIRVNDYTIQSELGGSTSCLVNEIMGIGTVSHETGHAFGLPDLYDTRGPTQGIGGWGLMGSGNYARPYSPASYDAWSLNTLGWATIDTLGASRTVTAGARLLTDTIFYAKLPNNPEEYVLLENRQAVLSDTAHMNAALPATCPMFGFCAKSPGLLVWLINQSKVDAGRSSNTVNFGLLQGVALIQADGLNQLRAAGSRNRGDRGDAYPGSSGNTKLSLLSAPAARDNFGGYFGFILDQIQDLGTGTMRFRFTRREPTVIAAQNGAQVRVNAQFWDRFEEVVPGGEQLQVSVDQVQLLDAGKTRAQFLAWSNGGPRDQTLTSHPTKPDTLMASFSLEHRLLLLPITGGATTSSVAGDLSLGVFLAVGATVTLTANPSPGFVFAGWRGDTVATSPTVQLTMRKGYDLEARFVASVSVVEADAIADLLGTPRLTDVQRTFLDELGNRNGGLDVGDLLAMLRRSGQPVPPALLMKAAATAASRPKEPR
jgi:M6 family metalloprotease-like protein